MQIEFGRTICPIRSNRDEYGIHTTYCTNNCALVVYKSVPKKDINHNESIDLRDTHELVAFCGLGRE